MKIDLRVLRRALNECLDHVESLQGPEVEVGKIDFYWSVPREELYATSMPGTLTLGSLADDWDATARIANGTNDPIAHNLVWAAALLRAVGEQVVG
ncbi:MAG: hypothetical protein H6721_15105 [Sandaracinus sp.]|nr:hypothetical protein [Sandaracinus sp.]